jgi:hypothetical protein
VNSGTIWGRFVEKPRGKKSRTTVPLKCKKYTPHAVSRRVGAMDGGEMAQLWRLQCRPTASNLYQPLGELPPALCWPPRAGKYTYRLEKFRVIYSTVRMFSVNKHWKNCTVSYRIQQEGKEDIETYWEKCIISTAQRVMNIKIVTML